MKLSELQKLLHDWKKYYELNSRLPNDPDVVIRQDPWEEKDIIDQCCTYSSDKDEPYFCLLTFSEEEYFNRPAEKPNVSERFKELYYEIRWSIRYRYNSILNKIKSWNRKQ